MQLKFLTCILFLLIASCLSSQTDSTLLSLDQLTWIDISSKKKKKLKDGVISGSRIEKNRNEIPGLVYIITAEEIRENDYNTLVDVLASLPGIRVSQPGSAEEGETFMMRGLLGNSYTKILINDVPLKPFVMKGLPIAAQLPIRQAERIEVLYGPQASLYGVDASAGVINIILPDTDLENDVRVQMGYGSNQYRSMNLMAGSRIRIGKERMGFYAYAGYTSTDDINVFPKKNTELFNPLNYQTLETISDYSTFQNYRGNATAPLLLKMPSESNYIGFKLGYNNLSFGAHIMGRKDHSSIGQNPLYAAHYNSANYTGENIISMNGSYDKTIGKLILKTNVDILKYSLDPQSNATRISSTLIEMIDNTLSFDGVSSEDSLTFSIFQDTLIAGESYSHAESLEWSVEQLAIYQFNPYVSLLTGLKYQRGNGNSLLDGFFRNTIELDDEIIRDLENDFGAFFKFNYQSFSTFSQLSFNYARLKLDFALHYGTNELTKIVINPDNYNTLIAGLYKVSERMQLRFSYGTALRTPTPYFSSNSYQFSSNAGVPIFAGNALEPEKTNSMELGISWLPSERFSVLASIYFSRTKNLITFTQNIEEIDDGIFLGRAIYANDSDSRARLYGIQLNIKAKKIGLPWQGQIDFSLNYSEGQERVNSPFGPGLPQQLMRLPGLRAYPDLIGYFNLRIKPFKRTVIIFQNYGSSNSLNRGLNSLLNGVMNDNFNYVGAFYKLNLVGRYEFNENFEMSMKITNVFDSEYGGIDASETRSNLAYNPQQHINLIFSANYKY